jgi:adenylate cyclase, class 2
MPDEIEIKFLVSDAAALQKKLLAAGFRQKTPRTFEHNTLYDSGQRRLQKSGQLLRLRRYGEQWTLTHKAKGATGIHKRRQETETRVENGENMHAILGALGFEPGFRYEKFRAEWTDGRGHVVVDETPIGNVAEIEGPAEWIDETASALNVGREQYLTTNYIQMFLEWKERTGSKAREMTFAAVTSCNPKA